MDIVLYSDSHTAVTSTADFGRNPREEVGADVCTLSVPYGSQSFDWYARTAAAQGWRVWLSSRIEAWTGQQAAIDAALGGVKRMRDLGVTVEGVYLVDEADYRARVHGAGFSPHDLSEQTKRLNAGGVRTWANLTASEERPFPATSYIGSADVVTFGYYTGITTENCGYRASPDELRDVARNWRRAWVTGGRRGKIGAILQGFNLARCDSPPRTFDILRRDYNIVRAEMGDALALVALYAWREFSQDHVDMMEGPQSLRDACREFIAWARTPPPVEVVITIPAGVRRIILEADA